LNEYFKKMIQKNELDFNDKSIKYNVYITQDKTAFDEMIKNDSTGKDKYDKLTNNLKDRIKTFDYKNELIGQKPIDVKVDSIDGTTKIIDSLRKNEVIKIENMVQSNDDKQIITFTGLDENQVYYVIAETVVEPIDKNGDIFNEKIDISKYSTIVTATTLKDSEVPEDSEKVPSAPINFISKNTTLNSTNILWDRVVETPEQGKNSKLEYEFIRVRGEELKEEFLKTKYSYDKTWEQLKDVKNKGGFKTSGQDLLEYKDNKFSTASPEDYVYESYTGTQGNILDKTLSPNQIYFYYIRTVRVVDGKDVAYSVWVPLSVTTKNVDGPKNLRVERSAEYNKKNEVVISFDIPKMNLDLIGTEYEILYSIKKDGSSWEDDKIMAKSDLTFKDNEDGKTMRVTYKIKGLSPGSMYTIRVRLFNKPMNSFSMYSNEVDHRTDGDNQNNEYDSNVESWDQNFKDLVEQLKKDPYWYTQNTTSNTTVIYRPEYFDNVLAETNTSIINLPEGIGGSKKEYYIPASAIIKAFEQNKGFKATYKGMDVIISAKSIDPNQNEAIKMLESRRKTDSLADYFVKITIDFKEAKYNIEGNSNISPVAEVKLEVIGTKEEIAEWDYYMASYVDELLKTSKYSTDFKEYIRNLLKDKKDNLFIGKEVNKYVEQFKTDFGKKVEAEIKTISRRTFTTGKLNGSIIIAYPFDSNITAKGYKLNLGKWVAVSTSDYAGKKAIITTELGSYTFTGVKVVINGIGNLPDGNVMTQIITKYGLDDYLGKNINLKANLTNNMAIGSLARIAGNSKTQDPIAFFKGKGVTISSRNSNSNISAQEAVYITMKVYEIRTNQKIDAIKITNYNKTAGIKGINEKYKKSIQVAFQLGIYNNENMNPSGTITVQEFLQMLANLSNKIGI
ncbi:MAG: fibronectin type III domain-containing protein, partial [Eubacteriales bacterium]|nr:fibronectin type III domain-containing protein [Eubacteriales bacterium]